MMRFTIIVLLLVSSCASMSGPAIDKTKMAEGYYMKGLSHLQQKNYELATVEFNRSIQTDSNYKQSYYLLGIISDHQGQYDAAIGYYKQAIDRDPDYSEAYNALGAVYSKQQNLKEALKAYKKALDNKLYPTPHLPYLNMGRLYLAQKEYEKAVESYREAKRLAKQDFILFELGTALFDMGNTKEAISEFREGVAIAPQNARFRYSLAIALLKNGDKTGAIAEFKKAAELAPDSDIALQAKDYIKTLR